MGRRGRPTGHRLSEESKMAIAESKRGQRHKGSTKDKISRSLLIYFKQFNSLSEEIENTYCRSSDDELCNWANSVREDLDNSKDVLTSKSMRNTRSMELTSGQHIEFYSHSLTPEFIMILKETITQEGPSALELLEDLL